MERLPTALALVVSVRLLPVQSKDFFAMPMNMSWHSASSYCQDHNTTLASITSVDEQADAVAVCNGTIGELKQQNITMYGCWIGLNDRIQEGRWVWTDASSTDYGFENEEPTKPTYGRNPWRSLANPDGEPNGGVNANCVQLLMYEESVYPLNPEGGWWVDGSCSSERDHIPLCKANSEPASSSPDDAPNTTAQFFTSTANRDTPAPSVQPTTALVTLAGTSNLIIETEYSSQDGWLAFHLLNTDECQDTSIVNVWVSDGYKTADEWVAYNESTYLRTNNMYAFHSQGVRFTLPMSVRFHFESDSYSYDVTIADIITSFDPVQYDCGAAVCKVNILDQGLDDAVDVDLQADLDRKKTSPRDDNAAMLTMAVVSSLSVVATLLLCGIVLAVCAWKCKSTVIGAVKTSLSDQPTKSHAVVAVVPVPDKREVAKQLTPPTLDKLSRHDTLPETRSEGNFKGLNLGVGSQKSVMSDGMWGIGEERREDSREDGREDGREQVFLTVSEGVMILSIVDQAKGILKQSSVQGQLQDTNYPDGVL